MAHDGGDFGASTVLYYRPDWRTGSVILTNSRWRGAGELVMISLQATTDAMRAFRQ